MKKLSKIRLILAVVAMVSLSSVGLLTGCGSTEHNAYVATTVVTQSVDATIGAFDEYSKTHPVSIEDLIRVRQFAFEYKASVGVARIAQRAYVSAKGTAAEATAEQKLNTALDAVQVAIGNVTRLIYVIAPELQSRK